VTAEQRAALREIVWVDPERMGGIPCFTGTRVPILVLIDHIEGNVPLEEFLDDFPTVSREQAIAFLEFAKDRVLECLPESVSC
jgi:uncharacterized protein (DUF433 family)